MTDRPIAADGDPAVAPEPGYYPDPSIPGFVRYWGGSAWVPGTSRLAPAEGEVLQPPRFATRRPAPGGVAAGARAVPPPVVPVEAAARSAQAEPVVQPELVAHAVSSEPSATLAPSVTSPEAGAGAGAGDTGPVYLDQTTGGASFVLGPRVAEVIGGPVFRTVDAPGAGLAEGAVGVAGAVGAVGAVGAGPASETSGWQADPRTQRGLLETGGAPRWVSWGVLPGAPEAEEGRAEGERAAVAVEVAAAVAPAMAVAVREVAAPVVERVEPVTAVEPVESVASVESVGSLGRVEAGPPASAPGRTAATAVLPAARSARDGAVRRRPALQVPAGLGRRLAARVVDTLVLLAVAAAAGIPLGRSVSDHLQQKFDQAKMASALTHRQVQVWLVDGVVVGKAAVLLGILLFVGLLYEVLPTARTGQTFGKRLVRIRVVDAARGDRAPAGRTRLSLGRSLLRWVVRQLGVVLLLGLVWPVLDRPARRGWQDRAARTRVVRG
ncbi:RDD family protein [Streptomyces rubellomurinus]|uniref:RDD family protein n=1 Tax=Streptomyces rubellomurinus (strain ATCC 31215) TaxID=359131 RepID=UPI000AA0AFB2|nr:RDD family protein [Streptomyces rubellomurinus]